MAAVRLLARITIVADKTTTRQIGVPEKRRQTVRISLRVVRLVVCIIGATIAVVSHT